MPSDLRQLDVGELPNPLPAELFVLDVRELDEWEAGHVDGSVHIPLMTLPQRLADVPAGREVLVVCKVGARSAQATMFLQAHGFSAANLAQGLVAWYAAGRPLVSESGQPPYVA